MRDDEGFPTICDAVYATVVADPDAYEAAALYWARSVGFDVPLVLLDWELAEVEPKLWAQVTDHVTELRQRCKIRRISPVAWIEGEALTAQANISGCFSLPVPEHLTVPDAWPSLTLLAGHYRDSGQVKMTRPALAKISEREGGLAGLPRKSPGPRGADPTAPAWVYGIVLSLDEASAKPPPTGKVKDVVLRARR